MTRNIFDPYYNDPYSINAPECFPKEHEYCVKLIKLFGQEDFAYYFAGALSIIVSMLDSGRIILNRNFSKEIRCTVLELISKDKQMHRVSAKALYLTEDVSESDTADRFYLLILQIMRESVMISGLNIDFTDVLTDECPSNLNIRAKAGKLSLERNSIRFRSRLKSVFASSSDENARKHCASVLLQEIVRDFMVFYPD